MHYTFLLPVLHDSHFEKRIKNIKKAGVEIQILGFERNHYPGGNYDLKSTSLGFVEHGKYLKRIPTFINSLFKVHQKIAETDVIYCFNIETLLIGWITSLFHTRRYKIVYDVADIREILIENRPVSALLRTIEKFLIKKVSIVVVTAPAYIEGYFHGYLKLHNTSFHVIENKVDNESIDSIQHKNSPSEDTSPPIKIGYFGVIRCNHSLKLLRSLIEESDGKFELYIRGIFQDHLGLDKDELVKLDNVEFGGSFISPDELAEMYDAIDISWTAIHHFKPNIMWSRTNRFYQACYFQKPIITQTGTEDAVNMTKYDIGCEIDLTKPKEALNKLSTITKNDLKRWEQNIIEMPKSVYKLGKEHEILVYKLS